MKFNDIRPEEYTDKTFGECIRKRREELGISVRALAEKLGMSPVYLSDIERGNRNAPTGANVKKDYMSKMIQELGIEEDETAAFYDLATATKGCYVDITSYLDRSVNARIALRLANEGNIPDEEWLQFIARINELNSAKNAE